MAQFNKSFSLDPGVLGPDSGQSISITGTTDAGVLDAIEHNKEFPRRPTGQLPLGSIGFTADGNQISISAVGGSVGFSFDTADGLGVFDKPADAIASLGLDAPPNLDMTIPGGAISRYLVMKLGYQAKGSFSGSHPLGVLGSVTFGAQASNDRLFAILHRVQAGTGADTALEDLVKSWRLPRQIGKPDDEARHMDR
jgi:hypothetical protein